jgi:hypothetical protein
MRILVGVVTILVLAVAPSALAAFSAHLVYSRTTDAAACPDEPTLRKAVAARFGYDPFLPQAMQTVVVLVSRDHGAYRGRVQLVDDNGIALGTRDVTSNADDCSELFDEIALAISIALDASMYEPPKSPAPTEPQPAEPDPTSPVPWFEPDVRDARPTVPAKNATFSEPSPWAVGGDLAASAGIGPSPGPRIAAFARVRPDARLPLSVAVELSVDWSLPSNVYPAGTVTSELYSASLAPCGHVGAGFFCALGQVGWMQASSSEVTDPGSEGMLFAAVGARAGAEWTFSERLFVRFHGDLLCDLRRPRFANTRNDATLWDAAVTLKPVVGALGLGVGYQIP